MSYLEKFDKQFTEYSNKGVWTVAEREGKCGGTALNAIRNFIREIDKEVTSSFKLMKHETTEETVPTEPSTPEAVA